MAKKPTNPAKAKKTKSAKKTKKGTSKAAAKKTAKKARKVAKKVPTAITGPTPGGMMFPASFNLNRGASEDDILGSVFEKIIARSNEHKKSLVCYSQLSDGQWEVCLLQSDGSYGQCKRYDGPVHTPVCEG
ncbi:cell division protein YceG involved in septum cleavage [Bradyrhizobium liaoningense]